MDRIREERMVAKGETPRDDLAVLVASEIEHLLRVLAPSMRKPAIALACSLAGNLVSAIAMLPRRKQFALAKRSQDLNSEILKIIDRTTHAPHSMAPNRELEKPLSDLEASSYGLQQWAGDVAGPTELERRLGIARSTLHRWQKLNEVIAFRTGGRKFVFPIAQFVDGRPVGGIKEVVSLFDDARLAWRWLVRPNTELSGQVPVHLLKVDQLEDVLSAAKKARKERMWPRKPSRAG
jgi:hypothetical protein